MFAHGSFEHLLGNMLFLILLGPALELRIGKVKFAISYLVSGLAATLMYSALMWDASYILVGASGAISGIIGTFLILYPREKIMMVVGFLILPNVSVWIVTAVWFLFNVILAAFTPQVAWQAHLGGFLAGALIGLSMYRTAGSRNSSKALDIEDLNQLVTNDKQRTALNALEGETNPDVKKAWLEYFAENTNCPNCEGRLEFSGDKFRCNCGYVRKVK